MRRKMMVVTAVAVAVAAGGGAAFAAGDALDDGDGGLSGPQADRAIQAALAVTGGGTANSVERDGEDGATYEVEITRPDGSTVDVRLDGNYELVVVDGDSESEDGGG
jgi:hypothetical protein